MRTRIVFHLWNKGGYVPFHHQYLLAQLIKGVNLRGNNKEFEDFNFYNFSGLKGQTQVSRKGLHFYSNKVTLVFSCSNMAFVEHFIDNLFSIEEFELGTLKLSPELIEKEEPIPMNEKMKYICISPIIPKKPDYIDPGSKSFINPEEDQFSDLIYDLTMRRMEKFGAYSENDIDSFYKFQLVPDKEYLHKLYQRKKKFARVYPVYDKDIKYEVRGYTFPFTLYAHPKVQEFVFNNGMGAFCHKGFGMLDIANSDPSKRVIMKRAREFA